MKRVLASCNIDFWVVARTEKRRSYCLLIRIIVEGGRRQEAGGRRQEAGGRRQEAGGRRQEAGGRRKEAGGRRQEAGGLTSVGDSDPS
jgi:hypothetical protein